MMKKVMLLSLIAVLCTVGSVYALPDAVAHWTMDGDAADFTGNGYDGTPTAGTQFVENGVFGGALDATTGQIDIPTTAWAEMMTGATGYTVSMWIYTGATASNNIPVRAAGAGRYRYFSCHIPNGTTVYFDYTDGSIANYGRLSDPVDAATELVNSWTHWTFVQTGANIANKIYRNGLEFDSGGSRLQLGAELVGGTVTTFFIGQHDGLMDDVRIYNVALTADEVQEVFDGVGLQSLGAHSPSPTGTVLSNDVPATTSVSWLSPMVDSDGIAIPDSNIVSVDNYAVWWGIDEEPNFVTDTPTNQTAQTYTPTTAITYDTTYYWRVDTTITLDANDITGDFTSVIEGSIWTFTTEPSYTPVTIASFDNALTTVDLGTAPLAVEVSGNSEPIYSVAFEILTDDFEYPVGSDASLSDDGPTALTTTLSTSVAGTYKVKVTVTDYDDANTGPGTTVEAIADVAVYEDGCQAAKDAPSVWTANYYDRDGNCRVDLSDYSVFAEQWMNDTSMQVQEDYTVPPAGYVPADVFANRIEAEWLDPNDPNVCSAYPLTDTTGIRIGDQYPDASGGLCLNNGTNGWVVYEITIPTAAVGNDVDVYVGYARSGATGSIMFGTEVEGEEALYGTITPLVDTGGWGTFSVGLGTVKFTADGPQRVKLSMAADPVNPDWFSFDW